MYGACIYDAANFVTNGRTNGRTNKAILGVGWSSTKLGGGGVTNILIGNGSGEWLQEWWVVWGRGVQAADNAIGGWTKLPHWDSSHEISLTTSTVFTLLPSLTSKTVLAGNVFVRVAIFKSNQEVKQCTPHLVRLSDRQEVILTLQL